MNGKRVIRVLTAGLIAWSIGFAYAQSEAIQGLQQQAALINQIADKFETEAAAQFGAGFNAMDWRRDFAARLVYQSPESLSAALSASSLSVAQSVLSSASTKVRAKHFTDSNWKINLITPCRIVDTRSGGGGVLGPAWRQWEATGPAATIAAQGGNAAGCGTFTSANVDGWLLYVTVVPTNNLGPDFLTVQHDPAPTPPSSATMNFYGQNIANFAITANFNTINGGFNAYASRNTHVVIDLLGWVGTESATALNCTTIATGFTIPASSSTFTAASANCAAGQILTGGGFDSGFTGATLLFYQSSPEGGDHWRCRGKNVDWPFTFPATCYAICCNVPSH